MLKLKIRKKYYITFTLNLLRQKIIENNHLMMESNNTQQQYIDLNYDNFTNNTDSLSIKDRLKVHKIDQKFNFIKYTKISIKHFQYK